jgi:hypothetical protein
MNLRFDSLENKTVFSYTVFLYSQCHRGMQAGHGFGSPRSNSNDVVLYHHTMSKKFGLAICRREGEAYLASSTIAKTGDIGEATFRSVVKVCAYKVHP